MFLSLRNIWDCATEHSFGHWSILSQLIVTALVMGKSRARERSMSVANCVLRRLSFCLLMAMVMLPGFGWHLLLGLVVSLLKVMPVGRPVFSIENLLFRSGAHVEL